MAHVVVLGSLGMPRMVVMDTLLENGVLRWTALLHWMW